MSAIFIYEFIPVKITCLILSNLINTATWFYWYFVEIFSGTASDGKQKLKGILQSGFSSMVQSGGIQNMGLIRILEYTLKVNDIPGKPEK